MPGQLSRRFLADEYDKGNAATLKALEAVAEEDFAKSLQYPDIDPLLTGEVTLEYLFGYVRRHFDSHATQIQTALQEPEKKTRIQLPRVAPTQKGQDT